MDGDPLLSTGVMTVGIGGGFHTWGIESYLQERGSEVKPGD